MGSNSSKTINESAVSPQIKDPNANSNPEDPRSPTPEIVRTPLQGKTGSKHNITKNADLRKAFEASKCDEKLIHNNPILSAVIKNHLQSYDPRSPTQDFERTPIVISSKADLIEEVTPNECGSPSLNNGDSELNDSCTEALESSPDIVVPKNLCNEFFDMSLKETDEPLGSSTASNEAIEKNMSIECAQTPKGLLETNFDYVENNECVTNTLNANVCNNTNEMIPKVTTFEILDCDPRSPSIGIERTPIVVAKNDEESSQENVETMSDDTLIKVLQNTNSELRQAVKTQNTEGVLIYEDESPTLNDTPKKSKSASNSGSRTPLSCMKNKADARSKSVNTLYDSKNAKVPSKIPKRVSHIPRLTSLSKQAKAIPSESSISLKGLSKAVVISGDCENTPPHSHRDRWDQDNSIVL